MTNFDEYQSPYTWRYSSPEMRGLWSERNKRQLWRNIWLLLAETQMEFGLVREEQVQDLRIQAENVDIPRALEIEAQVHHDLMAELKTYAEQCPVGGGILHLGATSMDIEDNADALRLRSGLDLLLGVLSEVLLALCGRIEDTADIPIMGMTHLQPAEPTTLGYRLSFTAQDLWEYYKILTNLRTGLRGKGMMGAVGTGAAYGELVGVENLETFQQQLSQKLNLPFFAVVSQTYPRLQEYRVISALAGLGAALYKFAFDLRLLQSPPVGEWSEPFGQQQVGSSAMPFKRNPINAEKIDSLARALAVMPQVAWQNAAHSLLERTLDDSANRRSLLPEAFLICDELLQVTRRLVKGLIFDREAMQRNLEHYAPFAATERVLMALGQAGADRQEMHEKLRSLALQAWSAIREGQTNPLLNLVKNDAEITRWLNAVEIEALFEVQNYTGLAPSRARALSAEIRPQLKEK